MAEKLLHCNTSLHEQVFLHAINSCLIESYQLCQKVPQCIKGYYSNLFRSFNKKKRQNKRVLPSDWPKWQALFKSSEPESIQLKQCLLSVHPHSDVWSENEATSFLPWKLQQDTYFIGKGRLSGEDNVGRADTTQERQQNSNYGEYE